MGSFADFATAASLRDLVRKIVGTELEQQRPGYTYAIVQSVDSVRRKCSVQYPGEDTSVEIGMGVLQPSEVGQVVRVDGRRGDRHVVDVLGPGRTGGPFWVVSNEPPYTYEDQSLVVENGTFGGVGIGFHTPYDGGAGLIKFVLHSTDGPQFYFRGLASASWANILASAFVVSSAITSKRDIEDLTDDPVAKLSGLRPVRYRRPPAVDTKGRPEPSPEYLGLIAGDVAAVYPEAVSHDDDGSPNGIDVMAMVAVLVRAVQHVNWKADQAMAKPDAPLPLPGEATPEVPTVPDALSPVSPAPPSQVDALERQLATLRVELQDQEAQVDALLREAAGEPPQGSGLDKGPTASSTLVDNPILRSL